MHIRPEVMPFLIGVVAVGFVVFLIMKARGASVAKAAITEALIVVILGGYMLYFFRDPDRQPPADPAAIVAGADGTVMSVVDVPEKEFLKTDTVRISIFLSLFDVHVNRAPIRGTMTQFRYVPGKRYFTFEEKSSEFNQHNSILLEGLDTRCLVNQIVGPVARRVVCDLKEGQQVDRGDRIGMMKFGSRLDMYFPKSDVEVVIQKGAKVRAGETVVARLKKREAA